MAAVLLLLLAHGLARADDTAAETPAFSPKGADSCLKCHDDPRVKTIFKTPHGAVSDARAPFAQAQCESCHGPGGEHAKRLHAGDPRPPIPMFGKSSPATVAQQNNSCLSCHQGGHRIAWDGSAHERDGVACVSCHQVHAEHDPVTVVREQPAVCYTCHRQMRADFEKFSAHPLRDGGMSCTSCHAPHDSLFPALLKKPTVTQTCYTCHADLRGPFLWEHPPVAEDCSNCHVPHGSSKPALLTRRPPQLCQQCHASDDHPRVAFTGNGLPSGNASAFVVGGSCLNCHSHVHGSNAPSGADLSR
jgi:DmsE family decaheme c-type cytochrome